MQVINYEELRERCLGDDQFVKRVLARFCATYEEPFRAIEEALAQAEFEVVARHAHRLKGAAANLSAGEVEAVASQLDEAARQQHLAQSQQHHLRLAASLERLLAEIEQYLADDESPG